MITKKAPVNILLVDDQSANLLALEAVLGSLGENLIRASSGEEALRKVLSTDFAAILLDVQMPTMDGFEVARLIRSRQRTRATPIIFITAFNEPNFPAEEAYNLGAVDYLTKPVIPAMLRSKINFFVDLYRKNEELAQIERERLAVALNAKEQRLRLILDNTQDFAFILIDLHGHITEWEGGAETITGWPAQEAVGQTAAILFTPEDRATNLPTLELKGAEKNGRSEDRRWHLRKDGSRFFADGVMVSLRGEDGQLIGYAKILRDATERELNENQRKRAEEDLRRMAAELSEANRRKNEFLATLAHELRNPLAPIRNGLEIIRLNTGNSPTLTKTQEMMGRQVDHMVHLVDDLLDIARISNGRIDLKKELVELKSIVTAAVEATLPLIEKAQHTLHVDVAEENLRLEADPNRLAQILGNLLANAAKYTPVGGLIKLKAHRENNELVISVSDNGIGIPADSLVTVFDMFSQLGNHLDHAHGGLGIGLALVRQLVKLHHGTVTVNSCGIGKGSTFLVRLPIGNATASRDHMPVLEPAHDLSGIRRLRILIADDNKDAADTLAVLLEIDGHTTRTAYDGRQALQAALEFHPEVAFLDIGMPRMTGFELAGAFQDEPSLKQTMLVALTGWGGAEDQARSRNAGFSHHLTKPVDHAAVTKLLSNIVGLAV